MFITALARYHGVCFAVTCSTASAENPKGGLESRQATASATNVSHRRPNNVATSAIVKVRKGRFACQLSHLELFQEATQGGRTAFEHRCAVSKRARHSDGGNSFPRVHQVTSFLRTETPSRPRRRPRRLKIRGFPEAKKANALRSHRRLSGVECVSGRITTVVG